MNLSFVQEDMECLSGPSYAMQVNPALCDTLEEVRSTFGRQPLLDRISKGITSVNC